MRATVALCRDCGATYADGDPRPAECVRLIRVYADSIRARPERKTVEAQGVEFNANEEKANARR